MALRLYDSAEQRVRDFVPLVPGRVGIYVCGATPQSSPHLGHLRAGVSFDVLRRWLSATGHEVTFVRNVTDIDDKILQKAAEADRPWWAHAVLYEAEFRQAYELLNVLPATIEPRATGHIPQMVQLVERLIAAGHAYALDSGDVYFDVRSWPAYGELTRQRPDDLGAHNGTEEPVAGKRDPLDFALWKARKVSEPDTAAWPAPWGAGRPGWHLECSAMATRYLGDTFDIHGGGLDLRFPHHENEWAQSRAAGDGFARYWLHNAWVVAAGEKMSKSLGNTLTLAAVLTKVSPLALRYLLLAPHYRSNIEVSEDSLVEAATAYGRIEHFVARAVELLGSEAPRDGLPAADSVPAVDVLPASFTAALNDDLATPAAVGVLHDQVRSGNRALADGDRPALVSALLAVRAMCAVLGVDPIADRTDAGGAAAQDRRWRQVVDALVGQQLQARAQARSVRDFAGADAIRDHLAQVGIEVTDTPAGATWSLRAEEDGDGG